MKRVKGVITWIILFAITAPHLHSLAHDSGENPASFPNHLARPESLPKASCMPGVYSDGQTNVVVLYEKTNDSKKTGYLTLDGAFGDIDSASLPFRCQSKALRLNTDAASVLKKIPLRQTLTTFISANTRLAGELIEPLNSLNKNSPLVVMVHGSEQEPAIGNTRARLLAGMGITVFVYDKRGTGQSSGFYTQNFPLLAEDAAAAMHHARSMLPGENRRAGFWGASQGGWVAPLAATLTPADFIVISYGLVASPIEEDLDQMLLEAEQKNFSAYQLGKIHRLSEATAKILLSGFTNGLTELQTLRVELASQPWVNSIHGEYSGAMLRMSDEKLRRLGRPLFDNLELIWDHEAMPVLEHLAIPILWIIAEKDREAPVRRTLQALNTLGKQNTLLETYIFPDTDHGMYEFTELPDGRRSKVRITDGYFRLVAEWINEKKIPYSGHGFKN
jgi:pimeloyl-ACP methyl ester carboxylesterase